MPIRSATGYFFLAFVFTLTLTACQTTETQRIIDVPPSDTRATITGTIVDSLTDAPLDSVTVSYRGVDRTLYTDERGRFTLPDVPPGVYVFDLSKYGYHDRLNVAAVVGPRDQTVDITASMLSQSLNMQCQDVNADYHTDIDGFLERDSAGVRLRTLDFVAEQRDVLVQPAITNSVNAPIFIPKNAGRYGNYELTLVKEDGTPVPFEYPDAPKKGNGMGDKDVYERGDVRVIVPRQSQRLEATRVRLTGDVSPGMPVYAKMRYTFSLDETLRPTPTSTFPSVTLDSLRTPFFDTLRVSDRLIVPDSLILGVDTTLVRVLGTDTTITRDGQVLYSSEEADTMDVNTALSLLRLREEEEELGPLKLPPIDTTRPPLYLVNRFDDRARDTLIVENDRVQNLIDASWPADSTDTRALRTRQRPVWRHSPPKAEDTAQLDSLLAGMFVPDSVRVDSLLSDSTLLSPFLPEPPAREQPTEPDTSLTDTSLTDTSLTDTSATAPVQADSVMAGSVMVDSVMADTVAADSLQMPAEAQDTTAAAAGESIATAPAASDSVSADSVAVDTTSADSISADSVSVDEMTAGEAQTREPEPPRITIDSLRKTMNVDSLRRARRTEILQSALAADTSRDVPLDVLRSAVLVDSLERAIRGDSLRPGLPPMDELLPLANQIDSLSSLPPTPQGELALSVPTAWSADSTRVLLLSPMILRQPMQPLVDSSLVADLTSLTPQRLILQPKRLSQIIVQQIILAPISVYREEYLQTWAEVQRENLKDPYCDIFRIPLETEWRSTTVK